MCKKQTFLSHTVQRKLRLFLLMQVYAWMGVQHLIFGLWLWKCSILPQTNQRNPKIEYRETCCVTLHQTSTLLTKPRLQSSTTLLNFVVLIMFSRRRSLLNLVRCSAKLIIKGRSPTMRHISRTHRVALDWLFDRSNVDPKIQIKCVDTKHQLADILTKGNFSRDDRTIFFICLTSTISALSAALRISALTVALKKWRKGCKKREEKR